MVQYSLHLRVAQPFQLQHKEAYNINHIQIHATYATVTFSVDNFRSSVCWVLCENSKKLQMEPCSGEHLSTVYKCTLNTTSFNAFLQLVEHVAITLGIKSPLSPHYSLLSDIPQKYSNYITLCAYTRLLNVYI